MASLYLVPTPIGNLEDMTYRAVRVLRETEALACEDTRRTRVLLEHYGIPKPKTVFSYHEHNELAAGKRILGLLDAGVDIVWPLERAADQDPVRLRQKFGKSL